MSLGVRVVVPKAGRSPWTMERQADMTNHSGVLMMQRLLTQAGPAAKLDSMPRER